MNTDLITEARDYASRRTGTVPGSLALRLVIELEAVAAERESAKRGAKTLGEIVDRHVEDTLRWAGMEDQIGMDDPDQQLAWELCAEMPSRIAALEAVIAEVANYAEDRMHYGTHGRTVHSSRIGSDLKKILARLDERECA